MEKIVFSEDKKQSIIGKIIGKLSNLHSTYCERSRESLRKERIQELREEVKNTIYIRDIEIGGRQNVALMVNDIIITLVCNTDSVNDPDGFPIEPSINALVAKMHRLRETELTRRMIQEGVCR